MMKKAVVLLAEGFEEVEAVTPIDYLRRAGIEVTVAAIGVAAIGAAAIGNGLAVKGARGITVNADTTLRELAGQTDWDAVVIPGGMPGASNIAASKEAGALIAETAAAGKLICAICASPAV
jgi:4-methyl-5(b-hydroxyethyl)-thiazole monophosphate biosynthesis